MCIKVEMSSQGPAKRRKLNDDLYRACRDNNVSRVRALLTAGADFNQIIGYWTPLLMASCYGQAEVVSLLLTAPGIDVNKVDNEGKTPLYVASWKGHSEVVSLMLAKEGVNMNQAMNDGSTPLFIASQKGHTEVVRLMLTAPGIDVNKADNEGKTPLYIASRNNNGHLAIIRLLLAAPGIDVNRANNDGETPLYQASRRDNAEVVSLLLHAGANPYQANNTGQRPLDVARNHTRRILERWLRSRERIFCKRLNLPADIIGEIQERIGLHYVRPSYHQYVNE